MEHPESIPLNNDMSIAEKPNRSDTIADDKYYALLDGDWSAYSTKREAQQEVCKLYALMSTDFSTIGRWVRTSPIYDEGWNEEIHPGITFGQMAIETAVQEVKVQEIKPLAKRRQLESNGPLALEVGINLTDLGNARRFVAAHGRDLRYCFPWGKWLCWNGQRWQIDQTGEVNRRAKDTIRKIYEEAAQTQDDRHRQSLAKHALRSEAEGKIRAMIKVAESEPGIPVLPEDMDRELSFLNLSNGTLNLSTGELIPHNREDLITKLAPVEFRTDAECPLWMAHLDRIFFGNLALKAFVQDAFGYSMTGSFSDKVLLISYGMGDNGKTVTHETLAGILGDYAMRTPTETLLSRRENSIPNDIARLRGARFVFSVEPEEGKRLAEALVKSLTGGDTVSARFLHAEWFDFKATFKIWLATNHKPIIKGTDKAIWNRIRLIPFNCSIPPEDQVPMNEFLERLKAEWPGILLWGLEGYRDWKKYGLRPPDGVKGATKEYRDEMDVLGEFISEQCEVSKSAETTAREIYGAYVRWCEETGEHPVSQRTFGGRLSERGFQKKRMTGGRYLWLGIGLTGGGTQDAQNSETARGETLFSEPSE